MKPSRLKCKCGAMAWKLRESLNVIFCNECGIAAYANTRNAHQALHVLNCKHSLGRVTYQYTMKCVPLKIMPDKLRVKICVFGERYWKGRSERKRIRYVPIYRVQVIITETIKAKARHYAPKRRS